MKKNVVETIRITSEQKKEIKDISEVTGFKQTDLIRFLLNRALIQIRADCKGDYSKLEFTLKHF
jgi:antitoxin component of RelBE/YafQ-DinJ toxin-antitoxin module